MKTTTKRICLAVAAVTVIAIAVGLLWKKEPPQILTLPNGDRYQFAGLTYGASPMPPALLPRLTHRLPASLANLIGKHFGTQLNWYNAADQFAPPRLFVWFLPLATNTPPARGFAPLSAVLADQDGVIAGAKGVAVFSSGVGWAYTSFPVVPRRSRELQCEFYTSGFGRGTVAPVGKVTFRNPLFGRFPQWQPEPSLAIKKAGDLEVRLDALGAERPPTDTFNTSYRISLRSSEGTNGVWCLETVELSDAAGNVLRQSWPLPQYSTFIPQPLPQADGWFGISGSLWGTLWPGEAAWRLRLELKRASGWAPGELITFRNVPLLKAAATNSIFMTNTIGPLQIVLEEHKRWDPTMVKYHGMPKFRLEIPSSRDDLVADVVKVTTDTGAQLPTGWGTETGLGSGKSSGVRFVSLSLVPTNATSVDITWAVQKTRTVEFLVKPPKAE